MASPATARHVETHDEPDPGPRGEWVKDAIDVLIAGALLMIALFAIL